MDEGWFPVRFSENFSETFWKLYGLPNKPAQCRIWFDCKPRSIFLEIESFTCSPIMI